MSPPSRPKGEFRSAQQEGTPVSVKPPYPANEAERLLRLRELLVLDSPPEPLFDQIAALASEVCGAPIALISLVDAERQWFKANVGLTGVGETPRELAFCAHAIVDDALFEVPDACADVRFAANPLVTEAPHIRFYAGAPLVLPGGERMGTLCVIDRQARRLDETQRGTLRALAQMASQALVMRRDLILRSLAVRDEHEQRLAQSESRHRALVEEQTELVSLARADGELVYVNPAYARHFGRTPSDMVGASLYEFVEPAHHDAVREQLADVLSTGVTRSGENRMVDAAGCERWVAWTNSLQRGDGQGPPLLHSVGRDNTARRAIEKSLRELTTILENSSDFVVQTDAQGRITYMNPAVRRAVGLAADAPVVDRNFAAFNTAATNRLFTQVIVPAVLADGVWVGETEVIVDGGRALPVSQMVIAHRDAGGGIERFSSVMRDISGEVLAKEASQRQAATLSSVIEAIPAIVAVVGADRHYRFVNRGFERWTGLQREHIVGRSMAQVLGDAEAEISRPWVARVLAGESVSFEKDYAGEHGRQHLAISYIPLRLDNGRADGFVGVAQDITAHKQEEVRLLQLAQRDALTGLLNRSGFEAELARAMRDDDGAALTLLYVDLDHFKAVNDGHGHPVGDQVLQQFAQRLQSLVRPIDAVARLGGDEFAVLLRGVRQGAVAKSVADKVIAAARERFEVGGLSLGIGASVGVAYGTDSTGGWPELVARADAMLYCAKDAGRGCQMGAAG